MSTRPQRGARLDRRPVLVAAESASGVVDLAVGAVGRVELPASVQLMSRRVRPGLARRVPGLR
jgi:hypothetical protein